MIGNEGRGQTSLQVTIYDHPDVKGEDGRAPSDPLLRGDTAQLGGALAGISNIVVLDKSGAAAKRNGVKEGALPQFVRPLSRAPRGVQVPLIRESQSGSGWDTANEGSWGAKPVKKQQTRNEWYDGAILEGFATTGFFFATRQLLLGCGGDGCRFRCGRPRHLDLPLRLLRQVVVDRRVYRLLGEHGAVQLHRW